MPVALRCFSCAIFVAALAAAPAAAQQLQQLSQQETRVVGGRPAADPRTPEQLKKDQERARQILEVAEGEARALEAPMRTLSLLQVANGLAPMDRAHAAAVLRDAFTASLGIERDQQTKGSLQNQILRALLPLDAAAVAELAPQAEPNAKRSAQAGLISAAARRKDFTRAMDMLNAAAADAGEFPYGAASDVMMALPPERAADRLNIFMQALAHYRQEDTRQPAFRAGDSMATLVIRYWQVLPPATVLEAIHLVLDKAKARSDIPAQVSVASASGSASFNSLYEYALFQVLPALRKLDEREAEKLLKDAQPLQPVMAKYPDGMQSLDPTMRDTPPKPGERGGVSTGVRLGDRGDRAAPPDTGMQLRMQYRAEVERIVKDAADNPRQAIARAAALPTDLGGSYPRSEALLQLAQTFSAKEPASAKSALDDLMKQIDRVEARERVQFLASAASLYARLNEPDAARKVLDRGFATAGELYEKDKSSDSPNEALKGFWPSTAAWRIFVVLATRLAPDSVNEIITGIKDDEIRVSERIAYAAALAGAPAGDNVTMVRHGNSTSVTSFDIPQ